MLETKTYSGSFSGVPTKISLNTVSVERGMSWISAVDVAMDHDAADDGFYVSKQVTSLVSPGVVVVAICCFSLCLTNIFVMPWLRVKYNY